MDNSEGFVPEDPQDVASGDDKPKPRASTRTRSRSWKGKEAAANASGSSQPAAKKKSAPVEPEEEDDDEGWTAGGKVKKTKKKTKKEATARKKRQSRKKDEEDELSDADFEAPRSVRYPKGVSVKALKRAKQELARQEAESNAGQAPVPGARPRRAVSKGSVVSHSPLNLDQCEIILELLEKDDNITPFLEPVDVLEYPDYLKIIQWPMDLHTVRERLDAVVQTAKKEGKGEGGEEGSVKKEEEGDEKEEALVEEVKKEKPAEEEAKEEPAPKAAAAAAVEGGSVPQPPGMVTMTEVVIPAAAQTLPPPKEEEYNGASFVRDVRLVWSNCLFYNRRGTPIYKLAKHFSARFEDMLAQAFQGRDVVEANNRAMPMSTRQRRVSRATTKSYAEDDFEDWWDDSEEAAILEERQQQKKSQVDSDGEIKLDKILAWRIKVPKTEEEKAEARKKREENRKERAKEKAEMLKSREEKKQQRLAEGANEDEVQDELDDEFGVAEEWESYEEESSSEVEEGKPPKKEYLVKWEGMSYLHVEWVSRRRIAKHRQKLRRFENTLEQNKELGIDEPDEPFDPRYVIVQRVIDYVKDEDGKEWYMVKWEELPYAEATWESKEDINDDAKIEEFERFAKVPTVAPNRPESKSHTDLAEGLEYSNGNQLRAYQLEGLNWLVYNWYQRRGSILADEMGLGKTVQAVSFLHYLKERENIPGPFMIACNLSTLEHWYREIREWTELNVVVYYGSREDRAVIREHEFFFKNDKGHIIYPHMRKAHIILTTYDMVTAEDWEELRAIRWSCIIVDEAQRMKGHTSKFRDNMISMICDHRVLLTGTPIQNNTTELWALLNFVDPREFNSLHSFQHRFGKLSSSTQVGELHDVLRPFLLRRMKEDVEKSIPPKEETIVEVELTSIQKQYYRAVLEQNRSFLNRGCSGHNVPHLLNVAIQLRKVCNHPYLLRGVEDKEVGGKVDAEYLDTFVKASGKMVLLDKLLPKLRADGHRVLIFSQMVKVLDLLETYLAHREWKWERIDGSIRGNDRQLAIDRFCKEDSDRFVFLLCTRAGGVGINLTAADTVVIFDSDWNPQNDVQAQARCHRIGQKEMVKVYRLITRNTYEREMFERSSKKLGLDQAVLHNMDLKADTVLDGKDVEELLRFGAYDLFREEDEDDDRARQFCEADIDKILENQAVQVTYDRKKMTADGSSFSKAVFQASAADRSLDLHAANFWDVVLGAEHNATYLLDQVQTGAATETDDSIKEFFKDLENVVDNAKRAWETGRAGELPVDLHILSKVLQIVVETPEFSTAQRAKAEQWYRTAITPSRRGRDDGDFGSSRRSSGASFRGGNFVGNESSDGKWTRYERSRLQKLIINFAAPRWKDMQVQAELHRRTEEEVKQYSIDFVRQCIRYAPDEDTTESFRGLLLSMEPTLQGNPLPPEREADDSLTESVYIQFIKNKCAGWGRRVAEVRRVHAALDREGFSVPPLEKLLARWWGPDMDEALLRAVGEHGMEADAMQKIVRDPAFPFVRYKPVTDEAPADGDMPPPAAKKGRTTQRSRKAAAAGTPSPAAETVKAAEVVEATNVGERQLSVEVVLGNRSQECDSIIEETRFPKDGLLWELVVPATGVLQKRIPYILKGISQFGRGEDELRAERLAKKRANKRGKGGRAVWSSRQNREFRAAVLRYGLGAWGPLAKATRHSEEDVAFYGALLDKQCRALFGEDSREPHGSLFGGVPVLDGYVSDEDEGMDIEKDAEVVAEEEEVAEEAAAPGVDDEVKQKKSKRIKKGENGPIDDGLDEGEGEADDNVLTEGVSEDYAHRYIRFMNLIRDIREKVLPHRRLAQRLATATECDMPEWWLVGTYDYHLLCHIGRFGFGLPEWTAVLDAPDCPYSEDAIEFLAGAVDKEKPLLPRLEYLRALVLNPPAVQQLTSRVGYQTFQPRDGHALELELLDEENGGGWKNSK